VQPAKKGRRAAAVQEASKQTITNESAVFRDDPAETIDLFDSHKYSAEVYILS